MSLSINAKSYAPDAYSTNSVGYTGPAHTMSVKDYVKLSRQAAAPVATFSGVARAEAKLTRTLTLTGALTPTHDAIFRVPVSIPVGAASADIDALCNDMGAWIATTAFKDLLKKQLIAQ
jgi:hypothetical protein